MNYFIFIVVYLLPWIMLGLSIILLGNFLFCLVSKNKSSTNHLRSLYNVYGRYLIFNIVVSLIILSVRLNMELITGYSIVYIATFCLLNLFSFLFIETNFFKFQSSASLKIIKNNKICFVLISGHTIKIFFIVMMIMNNIDY
jgi:hypothetical protein